MVNEANSIRQALILLLSTRPSERVMRPSYGCHLNRLVFSPNDDTTAGLAIHYVNQAIARWEPRIDVEWLDADRDPSDSSRLTILLEYQIRSTRQRDALELSYDLSEGSE